MGMQSSLERWNSTDIVEAKTYEYMETERRQKRMLSVYRGMNLLSQPGRVFARILERRSRAIVEQQLNENQFGFRKSKG